MNRLLGVHVRLPDGSEDVYTDESQRRGDPSEPERLLVEHYFTLMQDGYLFVFRTEYGQSIVEVTAHRRVAVYAPGGWHRVRSRWIPFTGPRHYEQLSQYE